MEPVIFTLCLGKRTSCFRICKSDKNDNFALFFCDWLGIQFQLISHLVGKNAQAWWNWETLANWNEIKYKSKYVPKSFCVWETMSLWASYFYNKQSKLNPTIKSEYQKIFINLLKARYFLVIKIISILKKA